MLQVVEEKKVSVEKFREKSNTVENSRSLKGKPSQLYHT